MTKCDICGDSSMEWNESTLEDHLRDSHHWPSVKSIYGDQYAYLFESDESPAEDDEDGEEDEPEEPNTDVPDAPEATATGQSLADSATGKKWYMIGVGGAGNNIIDAVLLRRNTLVQNNEERAQVWQRGLAGFGSLNTNLAELSQTYYAKELRNFNRQDLIGNAIIGWGKSDYAGAGTRWDIGKRLMEADFEDGGDPFVERWDMTKQDIRDAQALMFVHSVTKGTGCGATPVLASYIRDEVLDDSFIVSKPMLSSVVIPSEGTEFSEFGGRAKVNGVVGLARLSQSVDAVIPFDNRRLQKVHADITPRIEGIEEYNHPHYAELNKPLVAFLEAFTMSSIPEYQEATMSIRGDVFDVADSLRPVEDKYPIDADREYKPAVVLAPILGRSRDRDFDRSSLELLTRNAMYQNRLAEFDPQSAWGGTFLFYGPEEKMRSVWDLVSDGEFIDIVTGEEFLDAGRTTGAESVDIQTKQLVVPYLDDVYLWGTLWNPRLPSLEKMYEHAKELKDNARSEQAENLQDIWHLVDPLFSALGRENMA
ncbi:MAG: cell division protein FtsZ [Haloferacaceae archaeon]